MEKIGKVVILTLIVSLISNMILGSISIPTEESGKSMPPIVYGG